MADLALVLEKQPDETWMDCALRLAKEYELQEEVKEFYEIYIKQGFQPSDAALHACYEWDILPLKESNSNNPNLTELKLVVRDIIKKNI